MWRLLLLLAVIVSTGGVLHPAEFDDSDQNKKQRQPLQGECNLNAVFVTESLEGIAIYETVIKKSAWYSCSTSHFCTLTTHLGDSWGKLNDGFLFGNVHTPGMFQECEKIEGSVSPLFGDKVEFKGKYCTISFENFNFTIMDHLLQSSQQVASRSGPALAVVNQPLPWSYGTCMPSVCTSEDLRESVSQTFAKFNREVKGIYCTDEEYDGSQMDGYDTAVLVFMCLLILLCVLGTMQNLLSQYSFLGGGFGKALECFSVYQNIQNIFHFPKEEDPNEISCMYGMRFMTLGWIIISHQLQAGVVYAVNTLDGAKYQDPVLGQIVTNGWMSVETFFCLTGILITFTLSKELLKEGKLNVFHLYIGRIVRLLPSIFLVAIFASTLLRFLGWGPRKHVLEEYSLGLCRQYWWKDVLFIDNYDWKDAGSITIPDCLDHCWYTAIDMQLHLFIPLMLFPLGANIKIGILWLGLISAVSILIPVLISVLNDFPPFPMITTPPQTYYDYITTFYYAPWCRASTLIVGLWTGILLAKCPKWNGKPKKIFIAGGYVIAVAVMFALTFGLYHYNHVPDFDPYTTVASGFYNGLGRPAWGLCISYVVVCCHSGSSEIINRILSWKGWRPAGKLSFGMYLVHPVVQTWWITTQYVPVYFDYQNLLMQSMSIFFVSFLVALLLYCLIERPIIRLYRLLFRHADEHTETNISLTDKGIMKSSIRIPRVEL